MNHYSNSPNSQDGATYTSWTTMTKIKRRRGLWQKSTNILDKSPVSIFFPKDGETTFFQNVSKF